MAVNQEEGQSIIEFLLLLPLMVGLAMSLIWINTAIQISIVNQQYARAQTLFLAFNSPFYPEISRRSSLETSGINQMVIGVSDNPTSSDGLDNIEPEATVQSIATKSASAGASDANREYPNLRARVRIRNTVTLCTGPISLPFGNGGFVAYSGLKEGMNMNYFCGGQFQYE